MKKLSLILLLFSYSIIGFCQPLNSKSNNLGIDVGSIIVIKNAGTINVNSTNTATDRALATVEYNDFVSAATTDGFGFVINEAGNYIVSGRQYMTSTGQRARVKVRASISGQTDIARLYTCYMRNVASQNDEDVSGTASFNVQEADLPVTVRMNTLREGTVSTAINSNAGLITFTLIKTK